MLKALQTNRPYLLVLALVLAVVVACAIAWLGSPMQWPQNIPWMQGALDQPWSVALFFGSTLAVQALLFNAALGRGEVYGKTLPLNALLWVLIVGPAQMRLADFGLMLGLTAWLIGFTHLITVFRQQRVTGPVFQASFWTGAAVILCPDLVPLVIALILSLAYSRNFSWEEWAVLLVGLTVPLYIYIGVVFVWTGAIAFPPFAWAGWNGWGDLDVVHGLWLGLIALGCVGVLLFLGGYGDASNRSRNSKNQLLFACLALATSGLFVASIADWSQWNMWGFLLLPGLPLLLSPVDRWRRVLAWITLSALVANLTLALWNLWV